MTFALLLAIIAMPLTASPALATGDANESLCSNEALEGFSAALPDCRAYERVTPNFQNGFGDAGILGLDPGGRKPDRDDDSRLAGAETGHRLGPSTEIVHDQRRMADRVDFSTGDDLPGPFLLLRKRRLEQEHLGAPFASRIHLRPKSVLAGTGRLLCEDRLNGPALLRSRATGQWNPRLFGRL